MVLLQVLLEPLEALVPEFCIELEPLRGAGHSARVQPAHPVPPAPLAHDQRRRLQYAQMARDGRLRHVEWPRQLADAALAERQPRQHAASRRVSQRREGRIEAFHLTLMLYNFLV